MARHITELDIHSFRGIESLKLNNLQQINILTGDNNSGKTSVLEVIESMENPSNFRVWKSLIRRNGGGTNLSYYEGFYDLFNIDEEVKRVAYSVKIGEKAIDVELIGKESFVELTEQEFLQIRGWEEYDEEENHTLLSDQMNTVLKMDLQVKIDGHEMARDSVYEGQLFYRANGNDVDEKEKIIPINNIVCISPVSHAESRFFLSHVLNRPDLYQEMLEILKEFDEDIISLNYDTSSESGIGRGVYKILSKSHKSALPLNVYGDGMKKAVLLMSAVLKAKDGILLLDEFETAIHTSAMNKVFSWILRTCIKLNVQVFLTSHSKEAIDKVLKCAPDVNDKIALYTLYKDGQGSSVRRLTGRMAIQVQDDMGLELR